MSLDRVIVALDKTDWSELENLSSALSDSGCWMKVGMELYYAHGPRAVELLAKKGLKVFLDLKLHDIPTTVHHALANLMRLPVQMTNVHAGGGPEMLKASFEAWQRANRPELKLIAVTMLTSTTLEMMQQSLRIAGSLEDTVLEYARMTLAAGLHGVVCSPLEVPRLKRELGTPFLCVTPGIRPAGVDAHDQKRLTTPQAAIQNGSDFLVVGRAITAAADPRQALETLFQG